MNEYIYEWWAWEIEEMIIPLCRNQSPSYFSLIQLSVGDSLVWCIVRNGLESQTNLDSPAVQL